VTIGRDFLRPSDHGAPSVCAVDAGPIVYQSIFPITEVDTGVPADRPSRAHWPAGSRGSRNSELSHLRLLVACGDEWISLGKVNVQGKFINATEVLRVGDRLEASQ